MQPQLAAMLSLSQGQSVICERIFENRFRFVDELKKMGASIQLRGNCAIIDGVTRLHGMSVCATDLRAATGRTVVEQVEYIDRGYEDFAGKLNCLGADICRLDNFGNEKGCKLVV